MSKFSRDRCYRQLALAFKILACLAFAAAPLWADDQKPDSPPKPDELKILNHFIGTWDEEANFKITMPTPKEWKEKAVYEAKWSLNGWFVEQRGSTADAKGSDLQIMTFDVDKSHFRRWYFDSYGVSIESSGEWDKKTGTMVWTADLGDGYKAVSRWQLVDDNTIQWSKTITSGEGKAESKIEGIAVRRKAK